MKKSSAFSLPVLLLALNVFTASALQADVLATYTFTGGSTADSINYANLDSGDTSWTIGGTHGFSSGTSTAYVFDSGTPGAFDAGKFLEFTLSADPGHEFSLDSLSFIIGGRNYSSTLDYIINTKVRSSEDSYASDILINPGATSTASYTVDPALGVDDFSTAFTVDLSGSQFDNQSTITFRLYPSDDTGSGNIFRFDDIILNGTTAVIPEPGTASLVLLSVLGMLLCGRFSGHKK